MPQSADEDISQKVVVDAVDDDAYDTSHLLAQALPVGARGSDDVCLDAPPVTGEDYLFRVRHEAAKTSVVVANVNTKKFEKNRTPQYFQPDTVEETRAEFKAASEWQYAKCAEFSELRDRTRKERKNFLDINTNVKKLKTPKLQQKQEWHEFLFGKAAPGGATVESTRKPLLTILYHLDQATVVQLFDYVVEWIDEAGYSRDKFEWAYSLMCFVEKPVLPETHSSLRTLSRACSRLRQKLESIDDERLTELNLFIALIGRYFEQLDLADKS